MFPIYIHIIIYILYAILNAKSAFKIKYNNQIYL